MLYHGSPHLLDRLQPADSALLAVFATPCPRMAALYAGEGGHVYSFSLAENVRVLDASGSWRGGPYHYPDPEEWQRLAALLEDRKLDLSQFDCFSGSSLNPPLRDGIPCWEAIINDSYDITEGMTESIAALGYQVVLTELRYKVAANDTWRFNPQKGSEFSRHISRVRRERGEKSGVQAAILDPACIVMESMKRHPAIRAYGACPSLPTFDMKPLLDRCVGALAAEHAPAFAP